MKRVKILTAALASVLLMSHTTYAAPKPGQTSNLPSNKVPSLKPKPFMPMSPSDNVVPGKPPVKLQIPVVKGGTPALPKDKVIPGKDPIKLPAPGGVFNPTKPSPSAGTKPPPAGPVGSPTKPPTPAPMPAPTPPQNVPSPKPPKLPHQHCDHHDWFRVFQFGFGGFHFGVKPHPKASPFGF